jgi:hypothetical protein
VPSYLLIVAPDITNPSSIVVLDPHQVNEIIYRGETYEQVVSWLREDEFDLVTGRINQDLS